MQDLDVLLEERHVTKAAKRRGITQSAMSARLGKLRTFFEDPILVDGRPTLLLTPRAEALRLPLRAALGQLASVMKKTPAFEARTAERTFIIIGGDMAEAVAVPRLLARFRDLAPGMRIEMRRATTDLSAELGERGGDVAFEPLFKAVGSLHSLPIAQEHFAVMMRKRHPLAGKRLTMSKYLAYPHILIAPSGLPGSIVDTALAKLGKSRNVVAVLRHFTSAPIVCTRSDVLLTCPTSLVDAISDLMPVVTAPPPLALPSYALHAIWHERCHDDPAHAWLRDRIREG